MITVTEGQPFEAYLVGAPTGLVGTLGVTVRRDSDGSIVIARSTADIAEPSPTYYRARRTATGFIPDVSYTLYWDDSTLPDPDAAEGITVLPLPPVPVSLGLPTPRNIQRVFTDRARAVLREPGARVRGQTRLERIYTPYVRCRVDPVQGSERPGPNTTKVITHTMICDLLFVDGTQVGFDSKDQVEVERGPGGYVPHGIFEITGEVQRPRNLKRELLLVMPLAALREY